MKALITGGSGYFGSYLTKILNNEGFQCKVFDINEPVQKEKKTEYLLGDITNLSEIIDAGKNIDIIFHNIAQVPLAKNKKKFFQVNVEGTKNLIKSIEKNGIKNIVYTSSSAIFGVPKNNPVDENTEPNPAESYGFSKLDSEKLLIEYCERKKKNLAIIRPRTILGHGRLGIFQMLFEWVSQGYNIPVIDEGKNIYQFVHAYDLAKACIMSSKIKGIEVYNIGSEDYCNMRETLESLTTFAQTGSKVKSINSSFAKFFFDISSFLKITPLAPYHSIMYGKSLYFDTSKAKNILNWKSKFSNREMIIESYQSYLKNKHNLSYDSKKSAHQSKIKNNILNFLIKFF